jgi:hypothetical protein
MHRVVHSRLVGDARFFDVAKVADLAWIQPASLGA